MTDDNRSRRETMPAPTLIRRTRACLAGAALALSVLLGATGIAFAQGAAQTAAPSTSHLKGDNRARLFAISTGLPVNGEVIDRLRSQVQRELIDEHLRLQEAEKRHIAVQDREIAQAISDVEKGNNMAPGALAKRLVAAGIEPRTLIDQFRAQIAWGRVLRQEVGEKGEPTDTDIADQESEIKAQIGQLEFNLSEIFTSVTNPQQDAEAARFNDAIIQQLRSGAPFPVVAAQFSQAQTALQGGALGWVQPNQLDPAVLRVVEKMPIGAISNPIKVAGGYLIVTLRAKREIGKQTFTLVSLRQTWFPFTTALNPQEPTDQQISQLQAAQRLEQNASSCAQMEAANAAQGNVQPSDPGPVKLEEMQNPQMRALLAQLPVGRASQPLPAQNGIAVFMVCSREVQNVGMPSRAELMDRIVADRLELSARQLMRDLQRRALIDLRG